MQKTVFLFVLIMITILLIVCNAIGLTDIIFTRPLIWLMLSICNVSSTIDLYISKRTKTAIAYTLISIVSIVFFVISGMELVK